MVMFSETNGDRITPTDTTDKPFMIEKRRVYEAYKAVKSNKGAAGVDGQTIVDLCRGESFGFLGFDFRRVRSLRGRWRAHYTTLLAKLKDVFRRHQSQPVDRVIKLINPVV